MSMRRRDLLRAAAVLPAATWLAGARASEAGPRRLFVYEPRLPGELWRPLAAGQGLLQAVPIAGDRVRFARACLASSPDWIGGVVRPADLLVLAGSAEEEGFRMLTERTGLKAGGAGHVYFSMQRRGRAGRA
jgi:hypothetical protein